MRHTAGRLAAGIGGALTETIYPPVCTGCRAGTATPGTLCPACWSDVHFLAGPGCGVCGRDVAGLRRGEPFRCDDCRERPPAWSAGAAVFLYRGGGRRLVLALKHGDRLDAAPMLAGWMLRAGRGLVEAADLAVPVPLHWTRVLRRRFNQSTELARALARRAGRPDMLRPGCLARVRRTPTQEGRSREERALNLEGAFAAPARARAALAGRRVLLIDDVMTTGATLNEASRTLLDAGAARVDVLVMALVTGPASSYLDRSTASEEQVP